MPSCILDMPKDTTLYFPEDEFVYGGLVRDCDGNVIADANDETIEYDGGYFYAEPVIERP